MIDMTRRARANWLILVVLAAVALALYAAMFIKPAGPGS